MKRSPLNTFLSLSAILVLLLVQSCDPTYSIRIENKSGSKITVNATTTNKFQAYGHEIIELEGNKVRFEIPSGEYLECGMAIAGLDNDLPFTNLKIQTLNKTILAENPEKVISLFEKEPDGDLKTPYSLVIK
ncbi:hypothetical protein [Rufibacter sp. LB8]|uniref:hypothetical protein n=1 Tax=Rufibacter sp. LB8 TaxID=2777781 RepID=UPI00178C79E9|nr:hypothetical protein [Rufibacter sp. LB8]